MIRVVTDTGCCLTMEDYSKYNITAVPMYIREDVSVWRELFEISPDEFFAMERAGHRFSTSQPDPKSFIDIFSEAVNNGDEVICVSMSSGISGCINSANLARDIVGADKISVVDSKCSAYAQAVLVLKAVELAKAGVSRLDIVESLRELRERVHTFFVVKSLQYLYEGGRLSGAQALIGSLIQIKPIIWFSPQGSMEAYEKVRTAKAAKARLVQLVLDLRNKDIESIYIHYTDNYEEAVECKEQLQKELGIEASFVKLSVVLGSHTGPDILGIVTVTRL